MRYDLGHCLGFETSKKSLTPFSQKMLCSVLCFKTELVFRMKFEIYSYFVFFTSYGANKLANRTVGHEIETKSRWVCSFPRFMFTKSGKNLDFMSNLCGYDTMTHEIQWVILIGMLVVICIHLKVTCQSPFQLPLLWSLPT